MHHRFRHTGFTIALALPASHQDWCEPFGQAAITPPRSVSEQDNHKFCSEQHCRPLRDPPAVAERLAQWSEAARLAGRRDRADRLLLLAWEAYDRPARASGHPTAATGLLAA